MLRRLVTIRVAKNGTWFCSSWAQSQPICCCSMEDQKQHCCLVAMLLQLEEFYVSQKKPLFAMHKLDLLETCN